MTSPSPAPTGTGSGTNADADAPRLDPTASVDAMRALAELTQVAGQDLPPALTELVSLHVSRLNGCAYCTGLHHEGALAAGQSAAKLTRLDSWEDSSDFTPTERAALALAEHLTRPTGGAVPAPVRAEAVRRLGDRSANRLVWTIATTNAWNRVGVAAAVAR
ncbi:carboxymuconolactone decarboxylase family protein [Streptacidiphilus anmyonensis]|uniref:carboxymuconolactone decarboxylase family protein n=1 Tax=Streptacidiphilus anmyonensis TaxID=405782 RepID=UPI0005A8EE8C|nr:carboxymuconolactone decarboxylase family protein [Streptacidiphilus anmyonensis]